MCVRPPWVCISKCNFVWNCPSWLEWLAFLWFFPGKSQTAGGITKSVNSSFRAWSNHFFAFCWWKPVPILLLRSHWSPDIGHSVMDSNNKTRTAQMLRDQSFAQSSDGTTRNAPSPCAHLSQLPSILAERHSHNMEPTLASIHHEEGTSSSESHSSSKPLLIGMSEYVDQDRLLQILEEIAGIVEEEWWYLGFGDKERFLNTMVVFVTVAGLEWLYQGRKLYKLQSDIVMIDGLNNSEREHTKPPSTKEPSDSIDGESENSRLGRFDVFLQAIHGLTDKLLSEYQNLSREGVFQRQPADKNHQKRREVLQEVYNILQEIARGAKQLPRSQVASKSGAVQLIPAIKSPSYVVDPSPLRPLEANTSKPRKTFRSKIPIASKRKRLSTAQCAHPRQGSKSAGLFANNAFEHGFVPPDSGFGEYSDMFQIQAKVILRQRVRDLNRPCIGTCFSRSSRSSSQPHPSIDHLQRNAGGNPKPFGLHPNIGAQTSKKCGTQPPLTPFSMPSGLPKQGLGRWGAWETVSPSTPDSEQISVQWGILLCKRWRWRFPKDWSVGITWIE